VRPGRRASSRCGRAANRFRCPFPGKSGTTKGTARNGRRQETCHSRGNVPIDRDSVSCIRLVIWADEFQERFAARFLNTCRTAICPVWKRQVARQSRSPLTLILSPGGGEEIVPGIACGRGGSDW